MQSISCFSNCLSGPCDKLFPNKELSMKVRYIAALCLIMLLFAGWYFWDSAVFTKKEAASFYVPQDAVLFVEQKNIGALFDTLQNSRLGKTLGAMDFLQISKDLGLSGENQSSLEQSLKFFKGLLNNTLFREFSGKIFAFALLPADPVLADGESNSYPFKPVLITKPKHKAEILEIVSSVFAKDFRQSETSYKGVTIKKLQFDDFVVFAAVIDGYFLFSIDEQTIQHAYDVSRGGHTSLANNQNFQTLKKQLQEPEFMVFCSLEGLRQQLAKTTRQETPTVQKELGEKLASTSGLMYSAYGIWHDKELLRDSSITLVDPTKLDPFFAQLLSIPAENNDTLRFAPENILTYYWSNTLALSSIWKMYVENSKADPDGIQQMKAAVKKSTGKEISELLAMVDGGISFFMQKGDEKAFIPLPHFAIFLKLKDRQAGEEVLRMMIAQHNIPLKSESYKQIQYEAYDLALPGGLQALYGFQDNFLFISNSSDLIKEIINTRESGKSLQANETYSRMNINLEEGNNSVSYIRVADLLGGIKDLVGWGSVMLAMQDKEVAEKSRIIIEDIINPLLDGMTMFSTISTRSRLARDQIVVESVITLNPLENKP